MIPPARTVMSWLAPLLVGGVVIAAVGAGMFAVGADKFGAGEWACAGCTAALFVAWIVVGVRNRRWHDARRRGFPVEPGRRRRPRRGADI